MRKLETMALGVLAAVFSFSGSVMAASAVSTMTCRDFASTVADQWAQDYIMRAADAEKPSHNQIVVIAAGQKFFMPRRQPDEFNLHLIPVGQRVIERNHVYQEELARCLGAERITINVVK
jgi:hypothetical protein